MKDKFVKIMSQPGIKYADALDYIDNELKQSKKMAKINYRIRCFRNDGIYQLNQAISQVFGAVVSKEQRNPSGESSVQTVDITLADGTRVKAPYGDISLEGLGEGSSININYDSSTHDLVITGKYSVQSYLRQVELSRTKDMSVTPEKKFVDALLEVLHIEKNEKTFATFIRMMESAHGEEMSEYEEK